MKTRRLVLDAILLAFALIIYIIESIVILIPTIPFFKAGFSFIIILFAMFAVGRKDAWVIMLIRNILGAILIGNISMLMYSMCGGILSLGVLSLIYKLVPKHLSLIGASVVSAMLHNLGQIIMFTIVTTSSASFALLPYLEILGALAGAVNGFITHLVIKYIPQKSIEMEI